MGATRAMMHDQSLSFFLWVETCSIVVFVQKRSPHRALGCKTPEEMFTGKKTEIGHFRIFGCLTYFHVPFEKRTKLEPIAEKGIFVGNDETSKAFRIYLPLQRKVFVRRDVEFAEEKALRKSIDSELGEQQVAPPQVTGAPSQVSGS